MVVETIRQTYRLMVGLICGTSNNDDVGWFGQMERCQDRIIILKDYSGTDVRMAC